MDHIALQSTSSRNAIICGDPDRLPLIAAGFAFSEKLTDARGIHCWRCCDREIEVLALSSGIGAPATAIITEELAELGVDRIVRLGTCGALQSEIVPGTVIVPSGCIRDEGTSAQYIFPTFPAVPDLELSMMLIRCLQASSIEHRCGVVHCKDAYYLEKPSRQLDAEAVGRRWTTLARAGVLATEMESSALFILGALRNLRTAAVLVTVGQDGQTDTTRERVSSCVTCIKTAFKHYGDSSAERSSPGGQVDRRSYLD